jgi:uncharacterized membrane protein YphA (DoxX/SURF4 family)
MQTDLRNVAGWLLSLFLSYEFVLSGLAKLMAKPKMIASFHTFGYPLWFMYLTGCIELVCAVLVLIPRTAVAAAAVLVCVMIGALFSHLGHGQSDEIALPLGLLLAAVVLALVRAGRGRTQPA